MKEQENEYNEPSSDTQENEEESAMCEEIQENAQQSSQEMDYEAKYMELKDQYMRAFADFENTKKRLERDKNQSLEYAYERIMNDLLPVLDTLEKALESAQNNPEAAAIAQGLQLTLESFLKVLSKHGAEVIDTDGEFDPNLHECLMQVPDENKNDGEILQTLQKGFVYKQRVLRPSMVSVVKNQS
ncbi:nucleotide exchange factor GrpE [Helicobacter sp. MIT 21-1697]|uniref:nucleotide exchange factor GrpE n=1 Tax=Helicobacter sp. MIT 21-1697 TaxID=2993733 RepID=UPI00224AEAE1|nr:nucleotide exchange factor GrpE [Helicobacter sp. MIT 21-1697]MCX2716197.1 nucleotide exchange factor GrpE [Helicobacter sp. MIT 21-1697]